MCHIKASYLHCTGLIAGIDFKFTLAHEALPKLFIESKNSSSLTHLINIFCTSGPESCAEHIKDSLIGVPKIQLLLKCLNLILFILLRVSVYKEFAIF